MGRAWYTTRERVMRAADVKASAYLSTEIDAAIGQASQAVDTLCRRGDATRPGFAPWEGSITYDWPIEVNNDNAYRFYLNRNALHSVGTVTSGDTDISAHVFGWPETGPPYTAIDIDQGSNAILTFVTGAGQRSLVIGDQWGVRGEDVTRTGWKLSGAVSSTTANTMTIYAPIGVGSIVLIGTERVIVQERTWTTSGQTGTLAASTTAQTLAVSDGTAFLPGEELILDTERVLIRDIVGNNLIVARAVSGSTLAAHSGATIYWARSCTVERGALGTTAATHADQAVVSIYHAPPLAEQLTIAYALDTRQQETSAYARTVGQGENERPASGADIARLEKRLVALYGRPLRHRAV
jgi:hypothetical protein